MQMFYSFHACRNSVVHFQNYLDSPLLGIPDYGYTFALKLNETFFRAIRIDSEVNGFSHFIVDLNCVQLKN